MSCRQPHDLRPTFEEPWKGTDDQGARAAFEQSLERRRELEGATGFDHNYFPPEHLHKSTRLQ